MSSPLFKRRKHGTVNQIGQTYPVYGSKNKLPQRISINARPSWLDKTLDPKKAHGRIISYSPPTTDKMGSITAKLFGHTIKTPIQLVDKEECIGQWTVDPKGPVVLDKKIGAGYIRYLAFHENGERFLSQFYGIPFDKGGHEIIDNEEHRLFLADGHPESDWQFYCRQVRDVDRMNRGAKTFGISLDNAYKLLEQKRKAKGEMR